MGSPVPAKCTVCELVFSTGVLVRDGATNGFSNLSASCPKCGGRGVVAEGLFKGTEAGLEVISGPRITQEMVREFRALTETAQNKKIELPRYFLLASKIHPKFGEVVSSTAKALGRFGIVTTVLVASHISAFLLGVDIQLDLNRAFDQYIEYQQQLVIPFDNEKSNENESGGASDSPSDAPRIKEHQKITRL